MLWLLRYVDDDVIFVRLAFVVLIKLLSFWFDLLQLGDSVLWRQGIRGLLQTHEGSGSLQLKRPKDRRRLYQPDRAEVVRLGHLPV